MWFKVKEGDSYFQKCRVNFHKFRPAFPIRLLEIGLVNKFCARWILKMLTGAQIMQRMAFTFLKRNRKDVDEFLNHIVSVTGDEPWVSFVNVQTKEQ
jgi:hypothetical protein